LTADAVYEQRDLLATAESAGDIDSWLQDIPGLPRQQTVFT